MDTRGTAELRERLGAALGGAYTLERELGGGGMSRVFVAHDTRLGRHVVVKLLHPDLAAGLSARRFEREITLAARLQHPHVVPLLSAGEVDGLPYYTMPYVDGPSLRGRLRDSAGTGGPLGTADAVAILRDVARALAYAHDQGVVHRDIKPENVLLAGDMAVVSDFGIAKALEASATRADATPVARESTLTGLGTSLGTPAYMAPEQAVGEAVDARADLYAWGVVAYELLAGAHPFAGKTTAQQLIAAHLSEPPAPLASVAPGVPPAVAALVMRCLAKDPGDRPAAAGELVTALRPWTAGATTGEQVGGAARRSWGGIWRRSAAGLMSALLVLVLGGWYLTPVELRDSLRTLVTRPAPTIRVNRVVVAPFTDETRDPRLAALGALAADYLTEGLSRLGSLEVVDARTGAQTREVVRRIPRFLRPADDRALGEETGAKVVVAGSYYRIGDSVHFRARILDAATGAIRTAFDPVSAPARSPEAGVAALGTRVVAALRAASDKDAHDIGGLSPPPSLAAYTAFHDGYAAWLRGMPDSAVFQPLRRAIALDSMYGAPAVTLAYLALYNLADEVSDSALPHARRLRDRLTPHERALLDVTEAVAQGDAGAALEAAQHTGFPQLVAYHALLVGRPRLAIAALTATDPDRGLNLALAGQNWPRLAAAYAQIDDYARALDAVREGQRRSPALRELSQDLSVAAARGDVRAVREGLEARWRAGDLSPAPVVHATTLLRTRGGRDAEGHALATLWAERLMRSAGGATSPGERATVTTARLLAGERATAMSALLVAAERWGDVLRIEDARAVAFARDSVNGVISNSRWMARRARLQVYRAVALIRLGRRAEALAIDSAFARTVHRRWDRGASAMARGVIAAHPGERDRAVALLTQGAAEGGLLEYGAGLPVRGIGTVDGESLLLPLRADPRFQALAHPDPADEP